MEKRKLNKILRLHELWLQGDKKGEQADLSSADLRSANLSSANLSYADLRSADLRSANLSSANLSSSNLSYADLRSVDLSSSNLSYAKGIPSVYCRSMLQLLRTQKGTLIAYKYLDSTFCSPYQHSTYKIGKTYRCKDYDEDETKLCAKGLNVATLEWCLRDANCNLDNVYLEVEFNARDIVAIPYASDGKFRVKRFKIIRQVTKKELEKAIGG